MSFNKGWPTAMATLALLENGVGPTDPVVGRAIFYLRTLEPESTNVVSLQTQALCLARQPRDAELVKRNVRWLETTAIRGTKNEILGWSDAKDANRPPDRGDTLEAVAALIAADTAGIIVKCKRTWEEIREMAIKSQKSGGGWAFEANGPLDTYRMTLSGLFCLAAAERALGERDQGTENAMAAGRTWLGNNFRRVSPELTTLSEFDALAALGRLSGERFLDPGRKRCNWFQWGVDRLGIRQATSGVPVLGNPYTGSIALRFLAAQPLD